ncbi:MAG: phospholipid/cholesterol/gamma-HCH transport system substrate-binding protein [Pseudonocardiales bacterium]|nr:phospholipid/cholesterol/gamma-HCH transport system substrate-binding protein [Pseudonocardiales bacterium]
MRRNMVFAQLAVFATISLLVIGYAVFGLLGVRITDRPFSVTVELDNAGGIFEGAEVAYRGVGIGKVSAVDLHTDGVTITLHIDSGTDVPDNAIAHIYDLSAVGEQYVDLEPPKQPSDTYLKAGSVIPPERTTTPLETATVLYDLERFVSSINPVDVQIIGREGALAFQGAGGQLRTILVDTTKIVDQLSTTQDSMLRLLDNSAILLRGADAHSGAFDRFAQSLDQLTTTLAQKTPTVDRFLRDSAPTTQLVNSLITEDGSAIASMLANLASFSKIQVARIPGLRSLLVAVPTFAKLAPSVVHNGVLLGAANLGQDQALCNTGIPLTSPISGKRTPVRAASCGPELARGAANAPRPVGASAIPTGSGTEIGTYDPNSGLVATSNGRLYRLGVDGGQTTLFGGNSWQALLLAGTGS